MSRLPHLGALAAGLLVATTMLPTGAPPAGAGMPGEPAAEPAGLQVEPTRAVADRFSASSRPAADDLGTARRSAVDQFGAAVERSGAAPGQAAERARMRRGTGGEAHPGAAVRWDRGGGPREMAQGLPSPPGWYAAAMGKRPRGRVLYLTFDDGPMPTTTPRLLRALRRHQARATFFVTGRRAGQRRDLVARMVRDGHAVGNHSNGHERLTDMSAADVRTSLSRARRAIGPAQGPCMRPPFGLINGRVAGVALDLGMVPVLWTAHIEDWNAHSVDDLTRRLHAATEPGAIILTHDTNPRTVLAVERMLPRWKKSGYRLMPLPTCRRSG